MSFMRVNGGVAHYRDEGLNSGLSLVFINALGSDFRIWDEVATILAPEFRILRYDKRGHGLSESGPDFYDVADFARDLGALMDALALPRATVVGLSMGGLIAQEFYRQRPDLVAGLVLSGTAVKIGSDDSWNARIATIEAGGIESIAESVLERWFTADFRANREADLIGWRVMLTRTSKQGYLAACGAVKRADLTPYAGAIRVPTLCLAGDEDGSTPVDLVRATASLIPGARFETIAGAAHISGIERPVTVARLIAAHSTMSSPG